MTEKAAQHIQIPPYSFPRYMLTKRLLSTLGRRTIRYKARRDPVQIRFAAEPPVHYAGPVAFGLTACAGAFVVSAVIYDRNQVSFWERLRQFGGIRGGPYSRTVTMDDYIAERQVWMQEKWARLRRRVEQLDFLPQDLVRAYIMVEEKILSLSEAEKTLWSLIGINVAIFGCWQIPRLMPFMMKWFTHNPAVPGRSITMVTSVFSHQEGFHLALNMVGLYSFGMVIHQHMGREQFVASYLATGIGANVVSHVLSLATRRFRPVMPGLGASGAIYGLLAGTAVLYPNSSVSLIFLPFIPIKMGYALPAMMGFDLAGVMLGWRRFDHYAHLAGASIGLAYMTYGEKYLWRPLVQDVHQIRKNRS